MSTTVHDSTAVSASLASLSLARVLAATLVALAASVAVVAVVAQPALVVVAAVAALAVRYRRVVTGPVTRRAHERLAAERGRPAGK